MASYLDRMGRRLISLVLVLAVGLGGLSVGFSAMAMAAPAIAAEKTSEAPCKDRGQMPVCPSASTCTSACPSIAPAIVPIADTEEPLPSIGVSAADDPARRGCAFLPEPDPPRSAVLA